MRNSTCTFEHLSSTSHALINSSTNKNNSGMHLHASNYHNLSQMSGYFSPRDSLTQRYLVKHIKFVSGVVGLQLS